MDSIAIANAIILGATLIVISFYAYETWKLRKVNEKIFILEIKKTEPNIVTYFEQGEKADLINFVVYNEGNSTAYKIKLKLDKKFSSGEEYVDEIFESNSLFNEGLSVLSPKSKYTLDVGSYDWIKRVSKDDELKKGMNVTIKFLDQYSKLFEKSVWLNVRPFVVKDSIVKPKKVEETLENLENIFNETKVTLEKLYKNLIPKNK